MREGDQVHFYKIKCEVLEHSRFFSPISDNRYSIFPRATRLDHATITFRRDVER